MIRRATTLDVDAVVEWIKRDFPDSDEKALEAAYTEAINNRMNVCICAGEGAAIFLWRGPGVFEVHCFFEQRGKAVREISNAILSMMAKHHGARLVWAAIPDESRKVKIYVRWLGFKSVDHATFPHGPCEIFTWEPELCRQQL